MGPFCDTNLPNYRKILEFAKSDPLAFGYWLSNQENPGGRWVFHQPAPYFTDLMTAECR